MPTATWNGTVIARSEATVMVEGNHYFPPEDVERDLLVPSPRSSTCFWKGDATYYDVVVDGRINSAAAWTYLAPKEKAAHIRGRIAFWGGVAIAD